jgi:hypothetical protein
MPHRIKHTVRNIVKRKTSSVGTSVVRLWGDDVAPKMDVLHICNNHANQIIYVKWIPFGEAAPTITSTNFDEQIPAGESRQFQMESLSASPDKGIEFYLLGSGATTSYNAIAMKG